MSETLDSQLTASVLGLGIMGRAIAAHLQQDSLLAASWNRSARKDAPQFNADIHVAVSSARVILIVVIDGAAVDQVIDLILPELGPEHIVVQCATVKPAENIAAAKRVEDSGAQFVEALMGGSEVAVLQRKLPLYLGGDSNTVEVLDPILACFSNKRLYVGEVGSASVAKLAMNLNLAMQLEALCESYAYAVSNGLTDDQYFEVLRNNTGWNFLCEYKEPKLRQRDYAAQFSLKNMLKDIRLSLETEQTDHGLALLKQTEKIYAAAEQAGLGEEDMIALYKRINNS